MFCIHCGNKLREAARYCHHCGSASVVPEAAEGVRTESDVKATTGAISDVTPFLGQPQPRLPPTFESARARERQPEVSGQRHRSEWRADGGEAAIPTVARVERSQVSAEQTASESEELTKELYRRLVMLYAAGFSTDLIAVFLIAAGTDAITALGLLLLVLRVVVVSIPFLKTVYRLMSQLGSRSPGGWVVAVIVFQWLAVYFVNRAASRWCDERGIAVGLWGPR